MGWAEGCHQPDGAVTGVVVGVVTDLRPGVDFDQLEVKLQINQATPKVSSFSGASLKFPLEIRFDDLIGGDKVDAVLTAKAQGGVVVTREASTTAIAGQTLLYRAPITESCAAPMAPTCSSGQTCSNGACAPSFLDPRGLPIYASNWAASSGGDACKNGTDAPIVIVGEGQSDYLPLTNLEVAQVEAGPQGGFHVWLAARLKGLHQSGSVTTITGSIPDLAYDVAPTSVIFTFDPDEGGYCKIYGLRFRLDDDAHPVDVLLGKELDVQISVTDSDGTVGTGSQKVMLSTDIK